MADEKTEKVEEKAVEQPVSTVEQPVPAKAETPVPVKKPEPVEDIGETLDQFFTGLQAVSVVSMRNLLRGLQKKADDAITRLDAASGGEPPKKQG